MIDGNTRLIAHLGYPTHSFKAPMIYNPWFQKHDINAVVIPMGCKAEDYAAFLPQVFRLSNIHGAVITMPHKVPTIAIVDRLSTTARVAGSANAIRLAEDGKLEADMFDGEGFVRGLLRKGQKLEQARVLVVGAGGVGSAIAASLAAARVAEIALFDPNSVLQDALSARLYAAYPRLIVTTGSNDPSGFDVVINASPLGMNVDDPLPMDVSRIAPTTFVGEVVMKTEITPFLMAVRDRGCPYQVGTDMLFEQIPAYLEFFGFGTVTAEELRQTADIRY